MSKKEFKVGDRIRFVGPYMLCGQEHKGAWAYKPTLCTVIHSDGGILATLEDGQNIDFHSRQVTHRIRPKRKRSVEVDREKLAKAFDEIYEEPGFHRRSNVFPELAKTLGLPEE